MTDTALIRSEPHVEIGAIIARDADALVERWCERALTEQPSSLLVRDEVLRNQLLPLLQRMGEGLQQSGDGEPREHRDEALDHGEQRWDSGWSITEVVRDYQLLHLTILEHLEGRLGRPLRYREIMAVSVFIKDAIAASIAAYAAHSDLHIRDLERDRAAAIVEADRRKDDFLAVAVHELRNPVAPILNAARALDILLPSEQQDARELARVVRRQARQLARLLDDLSDLTRMAQGRLELRKTAIDVREVIEQAVQTCTAAIQNRGHRLTLRLPDSPLTIQGDAARLIQVVVNLLTNAAKYTPSGGEITVAAERTNDTITFSVQDTGIGVEPEVLSRVFDLYTRATDNKSPDGMGIGLAIVRELVALHAGSIECRSAGLGQGAAFVVELPASRDTQLELTTTPEPVSVGPRKLLIIDDDVDGRESLVTLLSLIGHHVESAADGTTGIQRAGTGVFDAALIDIGLPDLTGYQVAEILRQMLGARTQLIAVTGYARVADAERARAAGFDAHLPKPLDLEALSRLLAHRQA
jgi:signal transduction histidine kinase